MIDPVRQKGNKIGKTKKWWMNNKINSKSHKWNLLQKKSKVSFKMSYNNLIFLSYTFRKINDWFKCIKMHYKTQYIENLDWKNIFIIYYFIKNKTTMKGKHISLSKSLTCIIRSMFCSVRKNKHVVSIKTKLQYQNLKKRHANISLKYLEIVEYLEYTES